MEIYYIPLMEQGEDEATRLVGLVKSWPCALVYPDEKLLLQGGKLKANYRLSLADALIAAVAKLHNAKLVHNILNWSLWPTKSLSLPFHSKKRNS
jgi:uncharacterized protein